MMPAPLRLAPSLTPPLPGALLDAAWRRLEVLPGARRVGAQPDPGARPITLRKATGAASAERLVAHVHEKHVLVARSVEPDAGGPALPRRAALWLPLTPTVVRALLDEKDVPSLLGPGGAFGQPREQLAH